jgi:hypothetical protein
VSMSPPWAQPGRFQGLKKPQRAAVTCQVNLQCLDLLRNNYLIDLLLACLSPLLSHQKRYRETKVILITLMPGKFESGWHFKYF